MKYPVLFFFIILLSCNYYKQEDDKTAQENKIRNENLVGANKGLVFKEAELIENYVKRHNWSMETTKTGLRYQVYKKGNGRKTREGLYATICYTLSLLDGTECYRVDTVSPKKFRIGRGGVEYGLEQGILLLSEGDRVRMIMPPHLAHGLLGDEEKIPPLSVIVYDLTLLKVTDF